VVFEMHPLKAPSPDGLPGLFFRHYWPIVGEQVVATVQSFFHDGWMLKEMNHTFITLIPKVQGACNFNQFRPISLCNVYYNIISKLLVNRLRPLLTKIIDPAQVAFVPNRWINENVVIAQEVVHSFKRMKRKQGSLGIKLDFHKAYDKIEWEFIVQVLKALGFDNKFISLVYQCISTVSYTVLLNGSKGPNLNPSRGLRQGDPLSPYLFILGSEVLARLINREVIRCFFFGVQVAVGALKISKLFYADDVILYCNAKLAEVDSLMKCLNSYCLWSGQSISLEKTGVFASKGVHAQFLSQIRNIWGLKRLHQGVKYLGVPLFLSNNRVKDFSYVKERLESRTSGWKCKSLSWMGRATMIKSVAQSIPIYPIAAFQLPKILYEDMDSVVRRFW
jgi:hypothetical protein